MPDIFSHESTQKQIDALRELPPEQGGIGVVVKGTDVGVQGAVSKDLGKPGGWTFAAAGAWMRKQGASAAAWLNWSGT
jgi:hypothetical protein